MSDGRQHKGDLEYTADGIRDTRSEVGQGQDEQHVQASMQEETAKAMHRMAHAVEQQNEVLGELCELVQTQNELIRQGDG